MYACTTKNWEGTRGVTYVSEGREMCERWEGVKIGPK